MDSETIYAVECFALIINIAISVDLWRKIFREPGNRSPRREGSVRLTAMIVWSLQAWEIYVAANTKYVDARQFMSRISPLLFVVAIFYGVAHVVRWVVDGFTGHREQ